VAGYSTNRHTMDMRITVPSLYKVIAPGIERRETLAGDKVAYSFQFTQPAFPGSLAIVQGDPVQASSEGVTTWMYFHDAEKAMTAPYGEETGKAMSYLTSLYGLPPQANLTLVETEDGAPNGYSVAGILFLSLCAGAAFSQTGTKRRRWPLVITEMGLRSKSTRSPIRPPLPNSRSQTFW